MELNPHIDTQSMSKDKGMIKRITCMTSYRYDITGITSYRYDTTGMTSYRQDKKNLNSGRMWHMQLAKRIWNSHYN